MPIPPPPTSLSIMFVTRCVQKSQGPASVTSTSKTQIGTQWRTTIHVSLLLNATRYDIEVCCSVICFRRLKVVPSIDIAFLDLPLKSKKANILCPCLERTSTPNRRPPDWLYDRNLLASPERRIWRSRNCNLLSESIRHPDKTLVNASITSSQVSALTRCPLLSLSSEPKPKWPVLENQNAWILMSSLWTISATGSPSLRVVYFINPYLLYRSLGSEKHVIG